MTSYYLLCTFAIKTNKLNAEELKVLQKFITKYEKENPVKIQILEDLS